MIAKRRTEPESSGERSRERHEAERMLRLTAPTTDETDTDEAKNSGGGEK